MNNYNNEYLEYGGEYHFNELSVNNNNVNTTSDMTHSLLYNDFFDSESNDVTNVNVVPFDLNAFNNGEIYQDMSTPITTLSNEVYQNMGTSSTTLSNEVYQNMGTSSTTLSNEICQNMGTSSTTLSNKLCQNMGTSATTPSNELCQNMGTSSTTLTNEISQEVVDLQQRSIINTNKKAKYDIIITYIKTKLSTALDIIKVTRPASDSILLNVVTNVFV
uniref:LAG1_DNAbind domain-containing protein n=1 Tax=Strongyloides papillosus TaxID=174720 RepID=A0A0N5C1Q2_STREA